MSSGQLLAQKLTISADVNVFAGSVVNVASVSHLPLRISDHRGRRWRKTVKKKKKRGGKHQNKRMSSGDDRPDLLSNSLQLLLLIQDLHKHKLIQNSTTEGNGVQEDPLPSRAIDS